MSNGVKNGSQTRKTSQQLIDINNHQTLSMGNREPDFTSSNVMHQSVNGQIKIAIDPILTNREIVCTGGKKELILTGSSKASGFC